MTLLNEISKRLNSPIEHTLSDVKVHPNTQKHTHSGAQAYAAGSDIHSGPGQEKHLPHEAWHVVQQKQGRVK